MALRANAARSASFRKFCAGARAREAGAVEPAAPPGHMGIMSTKSRNNPQSPPVTAPAIANERPPMPPRAQGAKGDRKGDWRPERPEPTRYGDWESAAAARIF
jgi:hypothetical protein